MTYPKGYSPPPKEGDKDNAGISPGRKRQSRLAIIIVVIIIVVALLTTIIKSINK